MAKSKNFSRFRDDPGRAGLRDLNHKTRAHREILAGLTENRGYPGGESASGGLAVKTFTPSSFLRPFATCSHLEAGRSDDEVANSRAQLPRGLLMWYHWCMTSTSLSLLMQLRESGAPDAWDRLLRLYGPLLRRWVARYDLQHSDGDDVIQEVLLTVSRDIRQFDHNGRAGAFRAWLKTLMVHRIRAHWRARNRPAERGQAAAEERLAQLDDPHSQMTLLWNREHDERVLEELLQVVKPHFQPTSWEAFRLVTLEGRKPDDVARELGLSVNAVFIARSRVLSRLRQEADGLIESSSAFS